MSKTVVLTGVGHDRVGIVAEIAQALFDLGCNLMDSSMTLLRGEFAVILMVELAENQSLPALTSRLKEVEARMGFNIHLRELSEAELAESVPEGKTYMISVYGADKPGIVAGITRKLAEVNANITDVQTKSTKEGNVSLFIMILEVTAPDSVSQSKMEEALAAISENLSVDLTVQAVEVMEL